MNRVLKNPAYMLIATGLAVILFSVSYYALAKLPGTDGFACIEGAYLTGGNIAFSLMFAVMIGLFVVGFMELTSMKTAAARGKLMSLSGFAMVMGVLTTFCTACTVALALPFAAGFFALFTTYNMVFKVLGLLSLAYAMYVLNKQLLNACGCSVKT